MDGNGRWAQARGLPRVAGHRAGTENIRRMLRGATEFGIQVLTIYAFSTENWARPPAEVSALMRLLGEVIRRELKICTRTASAFATAAGWKASHPTLQREIQHAVALTCNNKRIILNVAFNYGGRAEIVDAVRHIMRDGHAAGGRDRRI